MTGAPDPKPAPRSRKPIRHVDGMATRRALLRRPWCALCGERAGSAHHLLARGAPYFGDDLSENLVSLCGDGVAGCHGLIENEDHAARKALGAHLSAHRPDSISYLADKLGGPERAGEWLRRRLLTTYERPG